VKAAQCDAIARSGQPCASPAMPGSRWCWTHDPATLERRRAAARLGGKARSNRERAKRQFVGADLTSDELKGILAGCISKVLRGQIESNVANAVASLVKTYIAVGAIAELEALQGEIEQLKAELRQQGQAA
jgi:hypothetical protein